MKSKKYECKEIGDFERISRYIEIPKKSKNEIYCVKEISKKVVDKLMLVKDLLEEVLNPDVGSLVIMYEMKISDIDYDQIWNSFKKVVKALRMYDLAVLLDSKDIFLQFLRYSDSIIDEVVRISEYILKKKIEFWSREIKFKKPREYLG